MHKFLQKIGKWLAFMKERVYNEQTDRRSENESNKDILNIF